MNEERLATTVITAVLIMLVVTISVANYLKYDITGRIGEAYKMPVDRGLRAPTPSPTPVPPSEPVVEPIPSLELPEDVEEKSSFEPSTTTYIYAENALAEFDGAELKYYHSDYLGSTRVVTNEQAEVVYYQNYMPFGEQIIDNEDFVDYTGKKLDEETDLYYFGARYYDPGIGRFTQVDPVLDVGKSPYPYVKNNPYKFVDPSGEFAIFLPLVPYAIATGLVATGIWASAEYGDWGAVMDVTNKLIDKINPFQLVRPAPVVGNPVFAPDATYAVPGEVVDTIPDSSPVGVGLTLQNYLAKSIELTEESSGVDEGTDTKTKSKGGGFYYTVYPDKQIAIAMYGMMAAGIVPASNTGRLNWFSAKRYVPGMEVKKGFMFIFYTDYDPRPGPSWKLRNIDVHTPDLSWPAATPVPPGKIMMPLRVQGRKTTRPQHSEDDYWIELVRRALEQK